MQRLNDGFWKMLDRLIEDSEIVIDRPKGAHHPRIPEIIYPLDYGYLKNTSSMDGDGIDLWRGSLTEAKLRGIIVTVDMWKRDSEIKLLLGCTYEEMNTVYDLHNDSEYMKGVLIRRKS